MMHDDAIRAEIGRRLMLAHAADADARRRCLAGEGDGGMTPDAERKAMSRILAIVAGMGDCTPQEGYRSLDHAIDDLKKVLKARGLFDQAE